MVTFAFDDVGVRACLSAALFVLKRVQAGDQNHGQVFEFFRVANLVGQGKTVHQGHFDIGEHQLNICGAQYLEGFESVDGDSSFKTGVLENRAL